MNPQIGILIETLSPLGPGKIKQSPEDFIVQEIQNGVACPLDGVRDFPKSDSELFEAIMVKKNLSTHDARHRAASSLCIPASKIAVCGVKDVKAQTAQRITFYKPTSEVREMQGEVFIHSISPTNVMTRLGEHDGNYFTIRVRDSNVSIASLQNRVEEVQKNGFVNFFGVQRFGPRQHNHLVGECLVAGNYDKAAKLLLSYKGANEIPEVQEIRQLASETQNYELLLKHFLTYSHELRSECLLLTMLNEGKTAEEFWNTVIPQTRFFCNTYGSYLFNLLLSKLYPDLPETLPTICHDANVINLYEKSLARKIQLSPNISRNLQLKRADIQTRIYPLFDRVECHDGIITLAFRLPKSSYATELIKQIFSLED